jgi:hypothetical protein
MNIKEVPPKLRLKQYIQSSKINPGMLSPLSPEKDREVKRVRLNPKEESPSVFES